MTRRPSIRHVLVAAALVAPPGLAGCVTGFVVDESEAAGDLSAEATQVAVGATTRAAVHAAMGTPNWSHDGLRVDAYRLSDRQWSVVAGILDPSLPIPFAFPAFSSRYAYVLIAYDAHGVVSAYDVADNERGQWVLLEADSVQLGTYWDEQTAHLALTGARRQDFLAQRTTDTGCLYVIGADPSWFSVAISIDGQPPVSKPVDLNPASASGLPATWLVPVRLGAGSHRVEARENHSAGTESTSLACAAGSLNFLDVVAETRPVRRAFPFARDRVELVRVRFETSASLPERYADRPLLIFNAGEWLLPPPEPEAPR